MVKYYVISVTADAVSIILITTSYAKAEKHRLENEDMENGIYCYIETYIKGDTK
ncbi:MAG: hypothetical protein R3Y05_01510 [bacterium]